MGVGVEKKEIKASPPPPFSLSLGFGIELTRTHDQFVYCTHEVKGVA